MRTAIYRNRGAEITCSQAELYALLQKFSESVVFSSHEVTQESAGTTYHRVVGSHLAREEPDRIEIVAPFDWDIPAMLRNPDDGRTGLWLHSGVREFVGKKRAVMLLCEAAVIQGRGGSVSFEKRGDHHGAEVFGIDGVARGPNFSYIIGTLVVPKKWNLQKDWDAMTGIYRKVAEAREGREHSEDDGESFWVKPEFAIECAENHRREWEALNSKKKSPVVHPLVIVMVIAFLSGLVAGILNG